MYDLIIIGSGPAGLSAAIYAGRARLNTLIIEKQGMSGGQVLNTYEVDNYPGLPGMNGFDMGMRFKEHADKFPVDFVEGEVVELRLDGAVKQIRTHEQIYEGKTVLIATGARHAKLNIPGEDTLAGRGVSYCATCDGAFFRNKTVAVVGGGDVAVEDAIFLARFCEKVYLIHRRNELRAAKILQDALFELPNVECVWDSVADEIVGEDVVSGIKLHNVKNNEEKLLMVNGVFIAVGMHPNSEIYREILECDDLGYIQASEEGVTNVLGVFVAGDIRTKQLRQIVTAVSDGANAVTSIQKYLVHHR
ncbi:MAG: thioredoxin-disulfide reductase [Lachnospiraceae bacterium]|nr:thioredoxin-disulfide reductase [Lachnospiraceae bacterium]